MRQLALPVLLCTSLLFACGKKAEMSGGMPADVAESAPSHAARTDSAKTESTQTSAVEQLSSSTNSQTPENRQLIRQAQARFRVKDVYQSSMQIENIVAKLGGFITQNHIESQQYAQHERKQANGRILRLTEYTLNGNITLRVPSAETQNLLHALAPLVLFLDERDFTAQDVALELLQQQLAQARNQSSAQALGNTDSTTAASATERILAQNQLQARQDEALIQSKLIADQVAFSTIRLNLYQDRQISRSEHEDISAELLAAEPAFGERVLAALQAGWKGTLEVIIALSHLWPLLLIAAIISLSWIWHRYKESSAKSTTPSEE
ncbi:DUF4349 domain-containing protein [Chitinibacter sp. FCG-7]|uniref:DUF4349 domain-containing protein n=1 Tax=Chitinibacter mangrovi TaxID=3153927 RepID=A0AAU7F9L0_9NEIS